MRLTLEAARVNAGYNQKEAAKMLGISRDSLRYYEQYKKSPKVELAIQMASLYKCTLTDLIFLKSNILVSLAFQLTESLTSMIFSKALPSLLPIITNDVGELLSLYILDVKATELANTDSPQSIIIHSLSGFPFPVAQQSSLFKFVLLKAFHASYVEE